MVTAGTDNPANAEGNFTFRCFQGTQVVSVYGETGRVTAGTGESVKLQAVNKIIIKNGVKGLFSSTNMFIIVLQSIGMPMVCE